MQELEATSVFQSRVLSAMKQHENKTHNTRIVNVEHTNIGNWRNISW